MAKEPRVQERKLGQHGARGLCWNDGLIEVDERLVGRERLEILLHEYLHHLDPEMCERRVSSWARRMARFLWRQRVRIIDAER